MYEKRMIEKDLAVSEPACDANPPVPPSVIVDSANNKATEILHMARAVNRHLFGEDVNTPAETVSPCCLAEALATCDLTLQKVYDELKIMTIRLGV